MHVFTINVHSVIGIKTFNYEVIFSIHSKILKQAVFRISQNTKLRNCPPFAGPFYIIRLILKQVLLFSASVPHYYLEHLEIAFLFLTI